MPKRGREKLPHVRGQGPRPRVPGCDGAGTAERSYPAPEVGAAGRSYPASEARGGDPEEPPQARGQGRQLGGATHAGGQGRRPGGASLGAVTAQAQEGLEELSHFEGQKQQR